MIPNLHVGCISTLHAEPRHLPRDEGEQTTEESESPNQADRSSTLTTTTSDGGKVRPIDRGDQTIRFQSLVRPLATSVNHAGVQASASVIRMNVGVVRVDRIGGERQCYPRLFSSLAAVVNRFD